MNKGGNARIRPLDGFSFILQDEIMTFYDELVWRGLIKDVSSEDLKDK